MKNKKRRISWQSILAIILAAVATSGFLWALLPAKSQEISLNLQEIRVPLEDDIYAMLQQAYQIQIKEPQAVKSSSQVTYQFKLVKSDQGINITEQDVDIYEYYQINIQLRPDLENTTINPPGSMTTALLEGQELSMSWKLQPTSKESIEGIFWVNVDFIPLEDDFPATSTAVLARQVQFPVETLFGLSTRWIIILSTALIVASIFFGIPQLEIFKGTKSEKPKQSTRHR